MRSMTRLASGAVLLCGMLTSCMLPGLAPYGAPVLSEKDVADSLAVLAMLEEHIRLQPRDPEAWHRRGMIAWALRERDRAKPPIKSLDWTLLGRMADTSLRIASQLRKESTSYKRDVTTFLLSSGAVWTPLVTQSMVNAIERGALADARKEPTPSARAAGIIRVARTYWRAYELKRDALKRSGSGEWPSTGFVDSGAVRVVNAMLTKASYPVPHDTSEADYQKAEELFREAYKESPDYLLSFPQLAMVLVARNRWTELSAFATHHLLGANFDPTAWMALGLASQRLGDAPKAATAFDYTLRNMPAEMRQRLDRVQRVMRPSDTLGYALRKTDERAVAERAFWMAADPLWSRGGADPRSEFLARIAYAELRWALPELSARGSDTDRGRIHVRYGPPDLIAGPDLVWAYDAGPVVTFDGATGLGMASLDQAGKAERLVESMPARWDNISPIPVDTMPLTVTRFRAGDSVDVYVAAHAPVARMQRSARGDGIRAYMWMITRDMIIRVHDSVRVTDTLPFGFTRRVPATTYTIRAEVATDGAPIGARGTTSVNAATNLPMGFELRGFGLSDVLVATRVTPRDVAQPRWTDFDITPLVGPIRRGGTLEVLWEIYDLSARNGAASYDVALTVWRPDTRSGLDRIAAEVIGAIGSVVGIERSDNRITSRFTRTVGSGRVIADRMTIGLGSTPPGAYTMTIDVTDRATGRTTTRNAGIIVQ